MDSKMASNSSADFAVLVALIALEILVGPTLAREMNHSGVRQVQWQPNLQVQRVHVENVDDALDDGQQCNDGDQRVGCVWGCRRVVAWNFFVRQLAHDLDVGPDVKIITFNRANEPEASSRLGVQ